MNTNLPPVQKLAQTFNCEHYSVIASRTASLVSLIAFAALTILWGNLSGASEALRNGLGAGSLVSLAALGTSEAIANYCKRFKTPVFTEGKSAHKDDLDRKPSEDLLTEGKFVYKDGSTFEGKLTNGLPFKATLTYTSDHTLKGTFEGTLTDGAPFRGFLQGEDLLEILKKGRYVFNDIPNHQSNTKIEED